MYHFLVEVGAETFEVDFAYPEAMLLIEVDGYWSHTTPQAFEEDRRRQNLLVDRGYMVRRYTTEPRDAVAPTRSPRRSTTGDECAPRQPRDFPVRVTGQRWPVTRARTLEGRAGGDGLLGDEGGAGGSGAR